jgi:hypothetical protein
MVGRLLFIIIIHDSQIRRCSATRVCSRASSEVPGAWRLSASLVRAPISTSEGRSERGRVGSTEGGTKVVIPISSGGSLEGPGREGPVGEEPRIGSRECHSKKSWPY